MAAQHHHATSPMSITQLCNFEEEQENKNGVVMTAGGANDADVRLAAEALGDMARSGGGAIENKDKIVLPPISSPPSMRYYSFSSDSSAATTITEDEHHLQQQQLIQQQQQERVSDYTLVNSAWRAFQSSKESVKYGAEMVESLAAPIYERYGPRRPSIQAEDEDEATVATAKILAKTFISEHPERNSLRHRRGDGGVNNGTTTPIRSRPCSRSTSPHRPYTLKPKSPVRHQKNLQTSRWHQLVLHAGSAAGTTAAVVSEESMKCLRYCLSWLQYAIQHIEGQMALLRSYLVSLASGSSHKPNNNNSSKNVVHHHPQQHSNETLAAIKKEMVDTVRKVVDVISRYASSSLPEQAKNTVRGFILELPKRWNTANSSTSPSPVTGPDDDPQLHETSIKLLNFGGESIEMLESVSNVFSDTVDRADLWLDRLRVMGVAGTATGSYHDNNNSGMRSEGHSSLSPPAPRKDTVAMDTT
ncbi:transcription factor Opi1-domain-containing protein [Zychaea mexicana]|uniref:transcription factor Opi1-domain-containing protein n=1 Tax=Zychaea mexicana TaxID=64656 RepID=UPI0022FF0976|nr:transcription factor Opi1-domain-containing protein [Zychaea mexicana]KAI9489028.1 transcription factor Opi1-domain-containing protein [Zychaea mexicana]